MKTIKINNSLSTNLYGEFSNVLTIEIKSKPLAEGAFGAVYICKTINNKKPTIPQVVKIFKEDENIKQDHNYRTIQKLQNSISNENKKGNNLITEDYPSLKGIPQFSFSGTLSGKKVRGFSSTNLKALGFEEFIDILDKDNLLREYQKMAIDKKMLIAFHLVSGFKLLQKIRFIHADLKPEALFINTKTNECAIIDFDSGAISENQNDEPNVWGSPNDWIAPEIWNQLKQVNSNGLQKVKVNLLSDLWSVTIGVHYILTTTHPLFYLKELSPRISKEYFSKYKWPNIVTSEKYFNQKNINIYKPVKDWLENKLNKNIFNELSKTINYGYQNPIKRTTYNEWEKVLKNIQQPPEIKVFKTNRVALLKGMQLKLEWNVENANKIEIFPNIGIVKDSGICQVNLDINTSIKIIASGYFGTNEKEIKISVFPTPIIETLKVPVPQFDSKTNIKIETPRFELNKITIPNINFYNNQIPYSKEILFSKREIKRINEELSKLKLTNQISNLYEKFKAKFSSQK